MTTEGAAVTITQTTDTQEGITSLITRLKQEKLALSMQYIALERRVTDAIIHAVEVEGRMTKYLARELFVAMEIEVPIVTQELTIKVTASGTFEPEIEVDEEEVRDQINSALYDEIESDWEIKTRYTSGLTGIQVTVEIEEAVRTIDVSVDLPWEIDRTSQEFTDNIEDAIREEIGSDWDIISWTVVE